MMLIHPDVVWFEGHEWLVYQEDQQLILRRDDEIVNTLALGGGCMAFPKFGGNSILAFRWGVEPYAEVRKIDLRFPTESLTLAAGDIIGNDPVVVGPDGRVYYQKRFGDNIGVYQEGGEWVEQGAPTGLSRVLANGTVRLVDEDRLFQTPAGVRSRPSWAGLRVAVEGADTGIEVWDTMSSPNRFCRLWDGLGVWTPRLCTTPSGWTVVTWGSQGLMRMELTPEMFLPFTQEPPPPPPPPPPEDPMNTEFASFRWEEADYDKCGEDIGTFRAVIHLDDAYVPPPAEKGIVTEWVNPGWPNGDYGPGPGLVGNCGIVAKIEGRWCVATYDWLRYPDQDSKDESLETVKTEQINQGKWLSWHPRVGEVVGLFVSTPVRGLARSVNQRSTIAWVKIGQHGILAHEGSVVNPPPPPPPPDEPPPVEPPMDLTPVLKAIEELKTEVRILKTLCALPCDCLCPPPPQQEVKFPPYVGSARVLGQNVKFRLEPVKE